MRAISCASCSTLARQTGVARLDTVELVIASSYAKRILGIGGVFITAKDTVQALLDRLPDDCTLDDVQYHFYVVQAVARGEADEKAGGPFPTNRLTQSCAVGGCSDTPDNLGRVGAPRMITG